jgi:zona occludens toxin (predicted ATPase)
MIILYSGTPGSGKSLDVARQIMLKMSVGQNFIGNMIINRELIAGKKGKYLYVDTDSLDPDELMEYAKRFHEHGKEHQTILVIDECQQIFNSRDWGRPVMKKWNSFFQVHRHYGFDVYLITQYDRLIDRQIRALIEYDRIHRKVSNIGFKGQLLSLFAGGGLFCVAEQYYPMKLATSSYFFKYKKKYAKFYDSYSSFRLDISKHDDVKAALLNDAGDHGAPAASAARRQGRLYFRGSRDRLK